MAATRRLAAIMFTDMVGSTALAQANEAEALRLRDEQEELVRPLFAVHQGREVKSMGDGFLAEFDSALRAVQCAIDIQERLYERNSQRQQSPIHLRIGIHLGDVETRGSDIFGDSVNIASRIHPLAGPGGICVTEPVFGQVRNKIPNRLEKLTPPVLKNVRFPVDIYRVILPWEQGGSLASGPGPTGIAVLPITNISPDPSDAYIADGLTEELITVLSQLKGLRVIARTSVMPYKSTSKGVSQIGAELGVSSVLEGSVRKAGSHLRIAVQLIDVGSQGHVSAHTYDRELNDVFAIQADIAKQVAEALKVDLRATEAARLDAIPVVRPDSYLAYLKGLTVMREMTSPAIRTAKRQFELAISLDDRNAPAHASLSVATYLIGLWYTDADQRDWVEASRRSASRALELDPDLAEAHEALGNALWADFDYTATEREFKRALVLNPSLSRARTDLASVLEELCRTNEALLEFSLAEAADPLWAFPLFPHAYLLTWLGRFEEAFALIQRLGELSHRDDAYHTVLADYYLARGDTERCLTEVREVEREQKNPRFRPILRARYLALSGEVDQAKALLRSDTTLPDYAQNSHYMAQIFAELGDLDECFRLMDKAVDRHNLPIYPYRLDPRLQDVRNDPRFHLILVKMNLA